MRNKKLHDKNSYNRIMHIGIVLCGLYETETRNTKAGEKENKTSNNLDKLTLFPIILVDA